MSSRNPLLFPVLATALVFISSPLVAFGAENDRSRDVSIDFDAALAGLMFDPATTDGNGGAGGWANGLLDSAEMALVATVLAGGAGDARATDIQSRAVVAWTQALESATRDVEALSEEFPTAATVVAGYAMVGTESSFEFIAAMTRSFGAPLDGEYSKARALGNLFGPDGDADGDGFSNRLEYSTSISRGVAAYVEAALDPSLVPDAEAAAAAVDTTPERRQRVGIVLFPGFEVLDVYGPIEMWGYVPEFELVTIAETAGPVVSAQGVETIASHSFASAPELDLLMVPGGAGTLVAKKSDAMLDFLRKRHEEAEITTSVCTGSFLLAAAGILDGRRATSNKFHFHHARTTGNDVEWIEEARWVDDGDLVTSSGVSAGMDMALHIVARLYGEARAEQLATGTEYIWNRDPGNDPFAASARSLHAGD
ncbi:MAG: DJ-1/PfpI family protein [Acidobacteriota bacterium]